MKFVGGVGYTNIDLIYSGMDRLPFTGEEVYSQGFGVHLGGGCPATLINTTRLGVPSRILTFVGKDTFSGFAEKFYESYDADIVNLYEGDGVPVVVIRGYEPAGEGSVSDLLMPPERDLFR